MASPSEPPESLDVAIVGGGIVGVASAWRLAALGTEVGLFERHELGSGASHGNAGQLRTSKCTPLAAPGAMRDAVRSFPRRHAPVRILAPPTPAMIRWLCSFARATRQPLSPRQRALAGLGRLSHDIFGDFALRHGELGAQNRRGALDVYETASGMGSARAEASVSRACGFACEPLGRDEARAIEPMLGDRIAGALWFPDDTSVDPQQLLAALTREARDAGAKLYAMQAVQRIAASNGRANVVLSSQRTVKARTVVIACGHATAQLARPLGLRVPIATGKGYSVDLPAPDWLTVPLVFAERHIAATPLGASVRLAGGMIVGARGARVPYGAAAALQRSAREVLPELGESGGSRPWAGLRPLTPDGLPMIGRFARVPNVIAAAGHGMLGLTQALGTAELVAGLCTGAPGELDASPFSPDRFSRRSA